MRQKIDLDRLVAAMFKPGERPVSNVFGKKYILLDCKTLADALIEQGLTYQDGEIVEIEPKPDVPETDFGKMEMTEFKHCMIDFYNQAKKLETDKNGVRNRNDVISLINRYEAKLMGIVVDRVDVDEMVDFYTPAASDSMLSVYRQGILDTLKQIKEEGEAFV